VRGLKPSSSWKIRKVTPLQAVDLPKLPSSRKRKLWRALIPLTKVNVSGAICTKLTLMILMSAKS